MPTRSLNSAVLKWPDRQSVDQAAHRWAANVVRHRQDVVGIGYFGSYARGDWGVGSDLDLIVVIQSSDQPFLRRAATWDMIELPVPTDLLVYTEEEWQLLRQQGRFSQTLMGEIVWVHVRESK